MKIIFLFLAALSIMGASSCKKSYACSCYDPKTTVYFTVNVEAKNVTDAMAQCVQQTPVPADSAFCNF
jgi:hypothetical protein